MFCLPCMFCVTLMFTFFLLFTLKLCSFFFFFFFFFFFPLSLPPSNQQSSFLFHHYHYHNLHLHQHHPLRLIRHTVLHHLLSAQRHTLLVTLWFIHPPTLPLIFIIPLAVLLSAPLPILRHPNTYLPISNNGALLHDQRGWGRWEGAWCRLTQRNRL